MNKGHTPCKQYAATNDHSKASTTHYLWCSIELASVPVVHSITGNSSSLVGNWLITTSLSVTKTSAIQLS